MSNELQFTLLPTQSMLTIVNANTTYCLMQRGGGKTTSLAQRLQHLDKMMPRCQILLFSDTYNRLMDRIVPNLAAFWEQKLKWVEGIHFVKYKRPPEYFQTPFIKLDKFDHVITLRSGTTICLVSLQVEGSANAYNAQAAVGDEVKFCDEASINTEVLPAIRGLQNEFGHLAEYLSVWMFTDKFGPHTKWLLKKRELQYKPAIEAVYVMQLHVWKLQQEHDTTTNFVNKTDIARQIRQFNEAMVKLRKQLVYVCEMAPYENKDILGEDYFKRARRICSPHEFDVAILNHDPDKVEQTFYNMFSSKHKHQHHSDYNPAKPIYITLDYNFRIVPIVVAQVDELPGNSYQTINIINALHVLHPKGITHAIQLFAETYHLHPVKTVHYIYDHTAIGRNPMINTFKDTVVKALEADGWKVELHYTHDAPDHNIKHNRINEYLLNDGEYAIQLNADKCDYLIKSIEQSPAKLQQGKTVKDKASERDAKFPAEESTHYSDAFDMMLWGLLECQILQRTQGTRTYIPTFAS